MTRKEPYIPPQTFVREYRDIRLDYLFDPSIFNDEPDKLRRVKQVIAEDLELADRVLILMYADCGSHRKLAQKMGVSHATIGKEIRRIRALILEKL